MARKDGQVCASSQRCACPFHPIHALRVCVCVCERMGDCIVNGIVVPALPDLAKALGCEIAESLSTGEVSLSQPHEDALWISSNDWNGQVLSAYFHPSRYHTASTVGQLGEQSKSATSGRWAVSRQPRASSGNRALYNTAFFIPAVSNHSHMPSRTFTCMLSR